MKNIKGWSLSLVATLLLASCGGGDPDVPGSGSPSGAPATKGAFTAVVSFGSSESDVGTYAPATSLTSARMRPLRGQRLLRWRLSRMQRHGSRRRGRLRCRVAARLICFPSWCSFG